MQKQIEQLNALKAELLKEQNKTAFLGSAISALSAAADNLKWHTEALTKIASAEKEKPKSEPAK